MNPLLEKISRLVTLAGDRNNENEARNAAVEACRLIRQYEVILSIPSGAQVSPSPVNRPPPPGKPIVGDSLGDRTAKAAREILNKIADPAGAIPWPKGQTGPREVVMASPETTPFLIKAKFTGKCIDCGTAYAKGDMIWLRKRVGCVHEFCRPEVLV